MNSSKRNAFTLVELLVVIAIIGILIDSADRIGCGELRVGQHEVPSWSTRKSRRCN